MRAIAFFITLGMILFHAVPIYAEDDKALIFLADFVEDGDSVGRTLVYTIKERIRNSAGMSLSADSDSFFNPRIITIDPTDKQQMTAYSIAYITQLEETQYYWNMVIGTCGKSVVNECALSIVADIDEWVTDTQEAIVEYMKGLPEDPPEESKEDAMKQKGSF